MMSDALMMLADLDASDGFVARHIGPGEAEIGAMLAVVGARSLDDLVDRAVPPAIRSAPPELPPVATMYA